MLSEDAMFLVDYAPTDGKVMENRAEDGKARQNA